MLFITSRMPTNNTEPDLNKNFVFDLKNNSSSKSFFCCKRIKKDAHEEIGSKPFLSEIKASEYQQVLLYIHGFSNMPEDVFGKAKTLQKFFDKKKPKEVLVLPIIWPCDNDLGFIKDYWDDQEAADQSASAFSRMFQSFMEWRKSSTFNPEEHPCLKRINVLAHSMGNRVLRETLWRWSDRHRSGLPLLFRNTFLVAADIVNESLHKGKSGELICHASKNVVVYYAADDMALRASKAANLKNIEVSRRLGHSGPENMDLTPKNVYAIDCDEVNMKYDPPKGHSYYASVNEPKKSEKPGIVFDHIFETIITGRVFKFDEHRKSAILRLP